MVAVVFIIIPVLASAAGLALESCILGGPLLMVPCLRSVHGQGADLHGQLVRLYTLRCWGWAAPRGRGSGQQGPHVVELGPLVSLQRGIVWEIFSIFCVFKLP